MSRGIAILGSTGSIGHTALKVVRALPDFHVAGIAAGRNVELVEEQIREFSPKIVSVTDEKEAKRLAKAFPKVEVLFGLHGASMVAETAGAETVVAAISGSNGLEPTFRAVQKGKRVALANKESLVMAGRLLMETARRTGAEILPVDSEHCAVFQCIKGESTSHVRKIILTASGGALRDEPTGSISDATVEQVLAHPNWSMGRKITVDSATMTNKALEVIEAHYLFNVPIDKISVMIHRESVVHSMVEFVDGSLMAQLAETDMMLPVQYALTYPVRVEGPMPSLDLAKLNSLTFSEPDAERYPCLGMGREAAKTSEAHVIAFNAANEAAVTAFLEGKISYGGIQRVIASVLYATVQASPSSLEEIISLHAGALREAEKAVASTGVRR